MISVARKQTRLYAQKLCLALALLCGALMVSSVNRWKTANDLHVRGEKELIAAINSSNFDNVNELLKRGIDPDANLITGHHPSRWRLLMVKLGIAEQPDKELESPLQEAINNNETDIAVLLIESGASVERENSAGESPLLSAAAANNVKIVDLLVRHHAHVNPHKLSDWTPLMYASSNANYVMARILLNAGANVHYISATGQTALSLTQENCTPVEANEVTTLLKKYGAKF